MESLTRKALAILFEFIQSFVIAGAIFVVTYFFLARPFQVNGQSMYPTYEHGDLIITNIISLRLQPLHRGDVIVFKAPPNTEKDFIKRVIAIPGDTIMVEKGSVYLNGAFLDESSYLPEHTRTPVGKFLTGDVEVKVPPGNYVVMGDHRSFSSDSREWGLVSSDKIIGKSFVIIWPLHKFGIVKYTPPDLKTTLNPL